MSSGRIADLVIAGVPKAATGSLFAYLAQHPDICGSDIKELGYFNHYDPARTQHIGPPPPIEAYASHWAHWSGERYALEATPTYSYGGRPVIDAMRKVLGSPKVVLILREPAERLWSAYTFQHSVGNNARIGTFEEYVGVLEQRRRDGVPLVPNDGMHGLHIGFYADYVGEWLDEFGDDMRIVFLDDLRRDPRSVVERLFGWLQIDTGVAQTLDYQSRNVTRHPRSKRLARTARVLKRRTERLNLLPRSAQQRLRPLYSRLNAGELTEQFDPAVRRHVEEVYRESNRTTAGLLAAHGYRDLPEWLRTGSTV